MAQISVIVPVYKAEHTLKKCTDSVLSQTFSDLELLLIDDGSPDKSGTLCDEIAASDSRVRVIHKQNEGVSPTRNLGLKEAKGAYIAFADADDWMAKEELQTLYSALKAADADSAGCGHVLAYPDGHTETESGALPAGVYEQDGIMSGIVDRLLGDRMGRPGEVLNGFIWRFLFDRTILTQHNITFQGAYLEDELFLMEYFCHAKRLAMVDEPLYYYLQNPESVTRNYLPDYMETFRRFMTEKRALAERFNLTAHRPGWEVNSNWAGLLIAIGNEYAAGNPSSYREKQRKVRELTRQPDMAEAIKTLKPQGLGRNKQLVADLVRRKQFVLLTALYAVKNRS
jgi:glycosyltransferase EpsJ